MNVRIIPALLTLLLPALSVSAQLNTSRAEEQEVQRLLELPDLTMRFQAAPLDDVLRTLCEASDMAYIGLPTPKGAPGVDMTIKGNPYQALLLVSQTYGYVPLYENGLWHFSPIKEERAKLYPKVYKLKNINVNEINVNQDAMNKAVSRDTSSALPQPVNSIAFTTDISKVITDIKALLELDPNSLALNEQDAAVKHLNPAAMLLSGTPSAELASRLGVDQTMQQDNLKGRIIADPDQNSLFIIATKEHHQWIDTYLQAIDIPRKLVLLETRFVEVSDDPSTYFGVDWGSALGESGYEVTTSNKDAGLSGNLLDTQIDKAILTGPELVATLHAISSDTDSRSLQHPSQVTVNNRQVVLRNVTQYPFSSGSTSNSSSNTTTTTEETEYVPIGTTVSLLPRILDGGNVELNIMINVSDLLGYQDIGGSDIPITTARDYSGQAIVASGNTLAIGGLDALNKSSGTTKVPVLGDIPILGYLFRSESQEDTNSNLVMFITATILDGYSGGVQSNSKVDEMLRELDQELDTRGGIDGSSKSKKSTKKYLLGN